MSPHIQARSDMARNYIAPTHIQLLEQITHTCGCTQQDLIRWFAVATEVSALNSPAWRYAIWTCGDNTSAQGETLCLIQKSASLYAAVITHEQLYSTCALVILQLKKCAFDVWMWRLNSPSRVVVYSYLSHCTFAPRNCCLPT